MNYTIIKGVEHIENITGRKKENLDPQQILVGYMANKLDECHEVLQEMDTTKKKDIEILRSTEKYMKERNIPFAITQKKNSRYNYFYVYGPEITRQKSESKKLPIGSC